MKTKMLGVGFFSDNWYSFYIFFWNRCIWVTLFGKRIKRPKYVKFNKEEFEHAILYDLLRYKLFFGLLK